MAKERTEKSKYKSRYSPNGWVTAAQYIIELVCERKAQNEERDLPVKFWNLSEWEAYFKKQLRRCHALLKKYDEKAIIRALKDQRASRIYSLHAPWLEPVIIDHQKTVDIEKKNRETATIQTPTNRQTIHSKPRQRRKTQGIVGKLRELDDEE